ncbi:MAG: hypothetical protein HZB25_11170 [Candidatus Eisenbacteria bacterium]|nr:hypothetical protein [Candidatus Eisenbacteria bacterium]
MGRSKPLDRSRLTTLSRAGTVRRFGLAGAGRTPDPARPLAELLDCLPDVLAAHDLREVVRAVAAAHRGGRPVVALVGAHVVKTGCGPVLVDLARRGILRAFAMSGATAIHDYELACFGDTSEDVAEGLRTGRFGMWEELGQWMNGAAAAAHRDGLGLGEGLGRDLQLRGAAHAAHSLLAAAWELGIPATVHVAIGTDIIHQHPAADGAALGATSLQDMDILAQVLTGAAGGVVFNLGSAVVLPEVFLKALTMARNVGADTDGMTFVNMDFQAQYRTRVNLLERPARECGGRAFQLIGPHEIMVPLVAGLALAELARFEQVK